MSYGFAIRNPWGQVIFATNDQKPYYGLIYAVLQVPVAHTTSFYFPELASTGNSSVYIMYSSSQTANPSHTVTYTGGWLTLTARTSGSGTAVVVVLV